MPKTVDKNSWEAFGQTMVLKEGGIQPITEYIGVLLSV